MTPDERIAVLEQLVRNQQDQIELLEKIDGLAQENIRLLKLLNGRLKDQIDSALEVIAAFQRKEML